MLGYLHRISARTLAACLRYRVTGLAAEAAFFAILSLPPLIFGLAGTIGYIAKRYDVAQVDYFRERIIALSSQALNPDTVDAVIRPTLDEVLAAGRIDVISVGFVLALWSGSRALNVFIDTITIMYGLGGRRTVLGARAVVCAVRGGLVHWDRACTAHSRGAGVHARTRAGPVHVHLGVLLAGSVGLVGRLPRHAVPRGGPGEETMAACVAGRIFHCRVVGARQLSRALGTGFF